MGFSIWLRNLLNRLAGMTGPRTATIPVESADPRDKLRLGVAQSILALDKPVDPYLVEACLSNFQNFRFDGAVQHSERHIPLLVETRSGAYDLIAQLRQAGGSLLNDVGIPSVYRRYLSPGNGQRTASPSRYLTCLVHQRSLVEFLKLDCVVRAQMGLARKGGVDQQLMDESDKSTLGNLLVGTELESGSSFSEEEHDANRPTLSSELRDRPVIGIIDDGFPFLHPAIDQRFARIWQQDPSDRHIPKYLGYGRVIVRKTPPRSSATRVLAPPFERARRAAVAGHGTSVTHLIAGTTAVLPQDRPAASPLADVASSCDLIAVQFPKKLLGDTAGGALCVHALDAVRYIVDRAETYAPELASDGTKTERIPRPVVINMSYGTLSGPHDGTSPLDGALAEMVARRPGLSIVVAAGNSQRIPCHASLDLPAENAEREIEVFVSPDNPLMTSVEVWMPALTNPWNVTLTLIDPRINSVAVRGRGIEELPRGGRVIFPRQSALGQHGVMALVIIDPTRMPRRCETEEPGIGASDKAKLGSPAMPGVWKIKLTNHSASAVKVDAWVERSDIADKAIRRQQAYFVGDAVTYGKDRRTLASPASSPGVYGVGALRYFDRKRATYSSDDRPLGRPMHFHYGDFGVLLAGLRTPGDHEGTFRRISGTSAAAPLFARDLVNNHQHPSSRVIRTPLPTTSPEVP